MLVLDGKRDGVTRFAKALGVALVVKTVHPSCKYMQAVAHYNDMHAETAQTKLESGQTNRGVHKSPECSAFKVCQRSPARPGFAMLLWRHVSLQQQARHHMLAFLTKMLLRLQPLMSEVEARQAANILWSLAKLGMKPDVLVPGMTDSSAQHGCCNWTGFWQCTGGMCQASAEPLPRGIGQSNLCTADCCKRIKL